MEESRATGWNRRWKKMENLRDPGYYIFNQQVGKGCEDSKLLQANSRKIL